MTYTVEKILRIIDLIGYIDPHPSKFWSPPTTKLPSIEEFKEELKRVEDEERRLSEPEKYLTAEQLKKYRELQKGRERLVARIKLDVSQACSRYADALEEYDNKIDEMNNIICSSK